MINSIHLPSPFSILCHLSLIPKIPCLSIALYGLLSRTQLNLFDLFSIPKQLLLQLFYLINDCITMLINFFTTCHLLPSSPFIKVTSKITISTILIFIHDAYFPIFKKEMSTNLQSNSNCYILFIKPSKSKPILSFKLSL